MLYELTPVMGISVSEVAHLEKRGERVVTERLWKTCPERLARPRVVAQSKVATDDVLEESDRLGLDELVDHVAKYGANGEESLVGMTDVGEPGLVEKDLLHDEDRDRLGKLRAGFHDAEAEGDDLGRKEEVYDRVVIILLRAFEKTSQKGVEKERGRGPALTRAPMTPREVRRRYSKGRVLEVVFKKGYKKRGICAVYFGCISRGCTSG